MSSYFAQFPKVFYLFGDETEPVVFQKLTKYSDVIDQYKNEKSTYLEYEIRDGDRPDNLSYELYGRSDYDWTFFLMNDNLREAGWPMSSGEVYSRAGSEYYKDYTAVLDIAADSAETLANFAIADKYPVGQSVLVSDKSGIVVSKNLEVGEITISSDSDLLGSTLLTTNLGGDSATLSSCIYEFNGTHHYVNDSGSIIDFFFSSDGTKLPVTNLENLISSNDNSRKIRIIKKDYIEQFVGIFKSTLSDQV